MNPIQIGFKKVLPFLFFTFLVTNIQAQHQEYYPDPDTAIQHRLEEWQDLKFGLSNTMLEGGRIARQGQHRLGEDVPGREDRRREELLRRAEHGVHEGERGVSQEPAGLAPGRRFPCRTRQSPNTGPHSGRTGRCITCSTGSTGACAPSSPLRQRQIRAMSPGMPLQWTNATTAVWLANCCRLSHGRTPVHDITLDRLGIRSENSA